MTGGRPPTVGASQREPFLFRSRPKRPEPSWPTRRSIPAPRTFARPLCPADARPISPVVVSFPRSHLHCRSRVSRWEFDASQEGCMAEPLLSEKMDRYLESLVPPRAGELVEMEAEARRTGFPIIRPPCGHFCYLVARLIGARQVFEMGSGYGYSTAWFARAVQENGGGRVVHTVWDEGLSQQARAHLTALGYADTVDFRV